jgi:hypothetical protein
VNEQVDEIVTPKSIDSSGSTNFELGGEEDGTEEVAGNSRNEIENNDARSTEYSLELEPE